MKYVFLDDHYDQGHFLMSDLENHQDCKVIYKDRLHQNAIINAFCCSHIIRKIKKRLIQNLSYSASVVAYAVKRRHYLGIKR